MEQKSNMLKLIKSLKLWKVWTCQNGKSKNVRNVIIIIEIRKEFIGKLWAIVWQLETRPFYKPWKKIL
jgi:hypothetical protein